MKNCKASVSKTWGFENDFWRKGRGFWILLLCPLFIGYRLRPMDAKYFILPLLLLSCLSALLTTYLSNAHFFISTYQWCQMFFPEKNSYLSAMFMVIHFQLLSSCHPLSLSLAMHCGRWLLNVDFHSLRDFTSTSWIGKIHDPSFKKPVHLTLYIFKQLFVRQVERMSSGYFLYQEK